MNSDRRRFVSVDLETTGLDPVTDYIVEVGLCGESPGDYSYFEKTFSLNFPEREMSAEAANINGWGQRPFAPVFPDNLALGNLIALLDDVHIVGKNPQFDSSFLEVFFNERGATRSWHHRLVDIGCLAWGYHQGNWAQWNDHNARTPNSLLTPPKSNEVCELLQVHQGSTQWHTAIEDASWVWQAFKKIVPGISA